MSTELKQAEAIVDLLQPEEKEQLRQYIESSANRESPESIGNVRPSSKPKLNREQTMAAWERIKQIASEEARQSTEGPSALEILSEMRNSRY